MSPFNAKAARAKRPCPLWADAFLRDTQHLEADEVGAYFLILMAMWTRESCDFPDDDARLARVSRVSLRLWKSRVGVAIRPFLTVDGGAVISKRLREEATYVERQVKQQSDRKRRENPDNPLDGNGLPPSADTSTDEPRHHPSQQPNNPTVREESAAAALYDPPAQAAAATSAQPEDDPLDGILAAARIDVSKDVSGKWFSQRWIAQRWHEQLGLSWPEITAHIAGMVEHRQGWRPPSTLKFFDGPMQDLADRKTQPALKPTPRPTFAQQRAEAEREARHRRWKRLAAGGRA